MNLYAIICAAGAGSRMGQCKALCRICPQFTFLEAIVDTLHRCNVHHIIVVTGAESERVRNEHSSLDVQWCENRQWQTSYMLESLLCGMEFVPENAEVLHWPVDCQGIHVDDLSRLLHSHIEELSVLAWDGVARHPMRISAKAVCDLRSNAKNYGSLRDFVSSKPCVHVDAFHEALHNCNTPDMLMAYREKMSLSEN